MELYGWVNKNNMILNIFQFKDDDNWKPEII